MDAARRRDNKKNESYKNCPSNLHFVVLALACSLSLSCRKKIRDRIFKVTLTKMCAGIGVCAVGPAHCQAISWRADLFDAAMTV
jgi:hypothetical protein